MYSFILLLLCSLSLSIGYTEEDESGTCKILVTVISSKVGSKDSNSRAFTSAVAKHVNIGVVEDEDDDAVACMFTGIQSSLEFE